MKTMKWTLFLAFFALWACQEEQLSQEGTPPFDSSQPYPRVERLRTIKRVDNAPATRAVGVKAKLWQPGDTIRIKFQNADEYPGMSDKVIQYAAIWLQYANLHFEYVSKEENADVKIGFNMDTRELAWSTIGTDCKQISQDEVSLNFFDLDLEEDEEIIQGEVLRNFGHVLGLGFEHRSPASTINLNEVKTLEYYSGSFFNLSEADIRNDILPYYNSDQTNYTEFDDESIMTLELPRTIQNKPYYNLYSNYILSPTDIAFVRDSLYPFPPLADSSIFNFSIKASELRMILEIKEDITIEWDNGAKSTVYKTYNPGEIIHWTSLDPTTVQHIKFFGSDSALIGIEFTTDNILSIDATGSKNLKNLICRNHGLNHLEISHNKQLERLWCDNNNLTTLTLDNPKLDDLICDHNQLTSLDVAKCPLLIYLFCSYNPLNSLDVSNNKNLAHFACSYSNLDSLNLFYNNQLYVLNCEYNNLASLDLREKPELFSVVCSSNKITSLLFSENNKLNILYSPDCLLTTLDVRPLKKLTTLILLNNPINRDALLDIANNIVDQTHPVGFGGALLHFSPVDDTIKAIFKSKGWSIYEPTNYNNAPNNYASFSRSRNFSERDEILKEKYLEYFIR